MSEYRSGNSDSQSSTNNYCRRRSANLPWYCNYTYRERGRKLQLDKRRHEWNTVYASLGSTNYTVTGTDANGCQNTDQITVTVVPVPIAVISSADPLVGNPVLTVEFDNSSLFATGYSWDFDDGSFDNTTDVNESVQNSFGSAGVYDVVLIASNGICSTSDTLQVIVNPFDPPYIKVPNVLTPNNDGDNDHFFFEMENIVSIESVLINRWGNQIMEMNELDDKWDGTMNGNQASEGTYFISIAPRGLTAV